VKSLSVVLNSYNEGHLLRDCLDSVIWADEIVVVDMGSQDDSRRIAQECGARVFSHRWEPIADRAHNAAFSKATGEWILLVAPDERVSPSLAAQIQETIASDPPFAAYRLPFKDFIFGKWIKYTGWQGNREIGLVRLFRRDKVTWQPIVHSQPIIDGEIGSIGYDETLDNAIIHINYTSVEQFIEKLNRYTTAEAEARLEQGKTFRWPKLVYHPLVSFWRRYVLGRGFRDGIHGFVLSVLMAFYADVILVKMWEQSRNSSPSANGPRL